MIYSIILILAWIPVFITYYPGIMPEDASVSVAISMGSLPWDNHFPVFYTLIVGKLIYIGDCLLHDVNLGIALYSVLQMVIMAGGLGYLLYWLEKKEFEKGFSTWDWLILRRRRCLEIMRLLCGRIHGSVNF